MTTVGTIKIGVDATEARRGAEEAAAALDKVRKEAKAADKALEQVEEELEDVAEDGKRAGRGAKDAEKGVDGLAAAGKKAAGVMAKLGASISATVAAFTTFNTLKNFESGLVGVGKTANIEGAALEALGQKMIELSSTTGTSINELLEIGQAAGQLGVTGEPAILAFTKAVAQLGSASNLAGEEAATSLARILGVTGESAESVGVLAAVIVDLGNTVAATEAEIAHMTQQIALATSTFGLTSAEAAALGATLTAMGVRAELGGSSVGRVMRTIDQSIRAGGERAASLSEIVGRPIEEIAEVNKDAVAGLQLFLEGLKNVADSGGDTAAALASLGLNGEEVLKVIPSLALNADALAVNLERAAVQTERQDAATIEAEKAFDTLGGQLGRLGNAMKAVQLAFRDSTGAMKEAVRFAGDVLFAFAGVKQGADDVSVAVTATAGALKVLTAAGVGFAIYKLVAGFIALKAAIAAAGGAAAALNAIMAANPIGLIAAGIAAAAAAFGLFSMGAEEASESTNKLIEDIKKLKTIRESFENVRAEQQVARALGDEQRLASALRSEEQKIVDQLVALEKGGDDVLTKVQSLAASTGRDTAELTAELYQGVVDEAMSSAEAGILKTSKEIQDFIVRGMAELGAAPSRYEESFYEDVRSGRRTVTSRTPVFGGVPERSQFAELLRTGQMNTGGVDDLAGLFNEVGASVPLPQLEDFTSITGVDAATAAALLTDRLGALRAEMDELGRAQEGAPDILVEEVSKARQQFEELRAEIDGTGQALQRVLAGESTLEAEAAESSIQQQLAEARKLVEAAQLEDSRAVLEALEAQIRKNEELKESVADVSARDKATAAIEKQLTALESEIELRQRGAANLDIELDLMAKENELREAGVENYEELISALRAALLERIALTEAERDAADAAQQLAREQKTADQRRARALESMAMMEQALSRETELLGANAFERQRYAQLAQYEAEARAAGIEDIESALRGYEAELMNLQEQDYFRQVGESMASSVGQGIRDLIQDTKDFEQAVADTAASIGMMVIDRVLIDPLVDSLADSLTGLAEKTLGEQATDALGESQTAAVLQAGATAAATSLTTAGSTLSTTLTASAATASTTMQTGMTAGAAAIEAAAVKLAAAAAAAGVAPSADGAVMSGGDMVPFAYGGVVRRATTFPMADGRIGLMGEAGPEAIMPLKRGRDGRLGVSAAGPSTTNNITNVTMNVRATDADSFRRSRRQIAQDLRSL